jgi:integrase/recombinase XerD
MRRALITLHPPGPELPALIVGAGKPAAVHFLEFFTVNIRNRNTRAAYAHASSAFLHWCEEQRISSLASVEPVHVAAYVELLGRMMLPPSVKQHLAAVRMLFDWMVTGQAMPSNPAHSVRGPRPSVSKGVTPVLSSEEATALLAGMDVSSVVGLRDRALIAVMTYTFARVGAVVALKVEDYFSQKKRWWLRLHEKNGKVNEMPCHHKLEAYLDAYIRAAGIEDNPKEPLFRSAIGKTKMLSERPMLRGDVWRMVRRRASDAEIETSIGCHTFRATGLYDRRNDDISAGKVERIGI